MHRGMAHCTATALVLRQKHAKRDMCVWSLQINKFCLTSTKPYSSQLSKPIREVHPSMLRQSVRQNANLESPPL